MKRVGTLLVRAFVAALLLLALSASVTTADSSSAPSNAGVWRGVSLPEDPGLE